ncbi:MAG TPA: RpiB/LacA/LacB family sugar-phosphate isomerase [Candidatus Baltobacteraceae bacterium]|jgi:ribose 5-phosphate isomerase B|nr:RpiB/LacA/LacB family sugar-phosphate isomerase [Candidatus Baltobacteraceae bacterium]
MRIALGSDEKTGLTDALERELAARGHEIVRYGALATNEDDSWPAVGRCVGEAVARGDCDFGIVCCWTGTGVSIAANKVSGVRAALCSDAQTAGGARTWNDANVLALSLRATTSAIAAEMLDAWFAAQPTTDEKYAAMIAQVP